MRISDEPIAKAVFGSTLKRKILRFLFKDQEPVSERELSRIFGVSHTAVNKAMKQLLDLNIIKGKTIGTALVWEINKDSFAYPHVKAFLTASETSPLESLKETIEYEVSLYNLMTSLGRDKNKKTEKVWYPFILRVYIIGSVAEGTSKPDSDIDVLFVIENDYDTEYVKELIHERGVTILEKYGNILSAHLYYEKDVERNNPKWLGQAIANGIKVV
ncbi:nucleotidyltransferase domain-containing protein [Candidatus Micrarchaeota archaeon]|nr:nucleotidyltransferase domain-containing protein [Candidatus Micrarchaeota archaeon]MBU1681512.1 nucleotidyltransferase domain-containing protein [Candidatus Micrarchaeota archaeon]